MMNIETGRIKRAARVIHTLIDSIITKTPINVVTEVISWVKLWLILV